MDKQLFRWAWLSIGGLVIVAGSFFATLRLVDYFGATQTASAIATPCTLGVVTALSGPFKHQGDEPGNHAFLESGPFFKDVTNTNQFPNRSPVIVCEDGRPLGPANSSIADIAKAGMGRFNHYMGAIFFSTSDNSDPNTNGRKYAIVNPKG